MQVGASLPKVLRVVYVMEACRPPPTAAVAANGLCGCACRSACHGCHQLDDGKVLGGESQNLAARRGRARDTLAATPRGRHVMTLARPRLVSSPPRPFVVLAISGGVMGRWAPSLTTR